MADSTRRLGNLGLGLVLGGGWYNQAAGWGTWVVGLGLLLGERWYSQGAAVVVALRAPLRPQQGTSG